MNFKYYICDCGQEYVNAQDAALCGDNFVIAERDLKEIKQHLSNKKTGQKKSISFLEVFLNTIIGYAVAILTQLLVFPAFDISITHSQNLLMGLIFTTVSIIRSYFLRRFFNLCHIRDWL